LNNSILSADARANLLPVAPVFGGAFVTDDVVHDITDDGPTVTCEQATDSEFDAAAPRQMSQPAGGMTRDPFTNGTPDVARPTRPMTHQRYYQSNVGHSLQMGGTQPTGRFIRRQFS
jgi:hypothetical protein